MLSAMQKSLLPMLTECIEEFIQRDMSNSLSPQDAESLVNLSGKLLDWAEDERFTLDKTYCGLKELTNLQAMIAESIISVRKNR